MLISKLAAGSAGLLALGAIVAAGPSALAATPAPVTVTFNGDATGAKPNGFASVGSPDVRFYDTAGADLRVSSFGNQSNGNGLGVFGDDTSALEIRLSSPTTGIKLAFGNDDPTVTNVTDQAQLTLFRGGTYVGRVSVNVNSNDAMDQTIAYGAGPLFNRAVFQYVNAADTPLNLIEIVDDIEVNPLCTIAGDAGNNTLNGTAGDDVICGDAGDDLIKAKGGNDLVYPGPGNDTTAAAGGNDTVLDIGGNDVISGAAGSDDVRGGGGKDRVAGGGGVDKVNGGPGRDRLNGGTGSDNCDGGLGRDKAQRCEVRIRIP